MMPGLGDDHPSIHYYDGDYPGTETSPVAANLDSVVPEQGLAHDVGRFREIALADDGNVLEIGCGTGRVLIPLARAGCRMTGIDISQAMIDRLRLRLWDEEAATRSRVTLHRADAREHDQPAGGYATIIVPFNGLSCIPDRAQQRAVIANAAKLLRPGGRLVIDVVNPLRLPLGGSAPPQPFFTRLHPDTGRRYTRFAAMGPIEGDQTQRLFGWYDEIDENGLVRRTPYEMRWRLLFAAELELLVEAAGLSVAVIEGDHRGSQFETTSPKIFMIACKPDRGLSISGESTVHARSTASNSVGRRAFPDRQSPRVSR